MADPLERDAMRALHMFLKALKLTHLEDWSDKLKGIGMTDLGILHHVAHNPDVILGDIKTALNIPHSTLTSAVNRLERRGLVRRVISARDRRSFGLVLTESGQAMQREHSRVDRMITGLVLESLDSEEERRTLIGLLEKISGRMALR